MSDSWVVLTSCFFPNHKPIKMLEVSAQIQGAMPLRTYGDGEQYANWTRMKVHRMIPELEKLKAEGFTHYLYTDGRDAFFTTPYENILRIYDYHLGRPDGLVSGHWDPFPIKRLAKHWNHLKPARNRFHCCGGYLGSIDYWLEVHRRFVQDGYESRPTGGDEAGVWQWAWVDGWFRPMVDVRCNIFQNVGGNEDNIFLNIGLKLENIETHTCPGLLHFTGYCKDQIYGVYDAMWPLWRAMYPDHPITKEEIAL